MNEFVSVSRNETVEILEPTKRGLHGLYGLYGLYGLHGLRGPHSLQSAVCVLALHLLWPSPLNQSFWLDDTYKKVNTALLSAL